MTRSGLVGVAPATISPVTPSGTALTPNASRFPNLHAAIANVLAGVSDAKICVVGDSDASGYAVTTRIGAGWAPRVAQLLTAAGIPAATGLAIPQNPAAVQTDPRITLGAGWALGSVLTPSGSWGGLNTAWNAAVSAAGTFTFTPNTGETYDSYDIYFLSGSGGAIGTSTATVPGGGTAAINGNSGFTIIGKATTTAGTAAVNQSLTIAAPTGGTFAGTTIIGVEPFLSTTKRVRVGCAAVNSASTVNWTSAPANYGPLGTGNGSGALATYGASLMGAWILEVGGDDAVQAVAPGAQLANYSPIATAMKVQPADIIGLTLTPIINALAQPAAVATAMSVLRSFCQSNGAGFIDTLDAWGGPNGFNATPQLPGAAYYGDGFGHPSLMGLSDLGRIVAQSLLAA